MYLSSLLNCFGSALDGADSAAKRNSEKRKSKDLPSTERVEGTATGSQSEELNGENDAFNRHYNKELRVSKDEIPIVLAELNDSAY